MLRHEPDMDLHLHLGRDYPLQLLVMINNQYCGKIAQQTGELDLENGRWDAVRVKGSVIGRYDTPERALQAISNSHAAAAARRS